jgi:hypothetical protein
MANRGDRIPERQKLDPYPKFDVDLAGRHFDASVGCWMRELPARSEFARKPRRSPPLPAGSGMKRFDVFDTETGARFGSVRADDVSIAVNIAGNWAVDCGFAWEDVHVSLAQ